MLKIAIFDPYNKKFTAQMIDWWEAKGHEVLFNTYYNPEYVFNADVVYFFTCDNNLYSATNPDQALKDEWAYENRPGSWDMHEMDLSKKKVVVHPVDIEVWGGSHAHDNMWNIVDDVIFPAPHIQKLMMSDSRPQAANFKQHLIPFGVDTDKFTFSEHSPGKKVAIVSEKWIIKGMQNIVQIAYDLPRDYEFHWIGQWSNDYPYFRDYILDFIERNNLNFTFYDWVDDLNDWLEDKNYLLHAGMKEAFTYAIAEGMSKGIKPIFHSFFGSQDLWTDLPMWKSPSEAVKLIKEDSYDSSSYRQYLIDHQFTKQAMMEAIDKVIGV